MKSLNATFKLDLETTNNNGEIEKNTIDVILQEISPFVVSDVFAGNLTPSGNYKVGSIVKEFTQEDSKVIVSPKNLVEQIEDSDNASLAIGKMFHEINQFCSNPKRYILLQKQSEAKSKDVGHSNSEHDSNGNKKND